MDEENVKKNTNEGKNRVNRSLRPTHEGLNEALTWTDERKELE